MCRCQKISAFYVYECQCIPQQSINQRFPIPSPIPSPIITDPIMIGEEANISVPVFVDPPAIPEPPLIPPLMDESVLLDEVVSQVLVPITSTEIINFRNQTLLNHNRQRTLNLLPILTINSILQSLAQRQARYMATYDIFAHTVNLGQKLTSAGYLWSTYGENIAYYTWTGNVIDVANKIFRLWINSPGHRANILNSRFRDIGIGYARSAIGRSYAVVIFGRRL